MFIKEENEFSKENSFIKKGKLNLINWKISKIWVLKVTTKISNMYKTEMNPVSKAKTKANSKTMCHHLNFFYQGE